MQKYDYFLAPEQLTSDTGIVIHNVGFSQCPPGYTYGWDTRDYYLLHYCLSGHGTYSVGEKSYRIHPGDGFLITPGSTIMHLSDPKNPWNLCWVGFQGERAAHYLKRANLDQNHLLFCYTKDTLFETCIENLYDKARSPEVSALTLTGYLFLLLGALADSHQAEKYSNIPLNHFEKAVRFINHNIRSPLTVEQLAAENNIAPSQLYRIFIKACGLGPKQYLDTAKIKKACELMVKTDLSMHGIAGYLGYDYDTHFYKIFQRIMGEKPSAYKERIHTKDLPQTEDTNNGNFFFHPVCP